MSSISSPVASMPTFDFAALKHALNEGAALDAEALAITHPSLFSQAALYLSAATLQAMRELIAAIEYVVALPAYQNRVLGWAPSSAQCPVPARSVFFGYDFHVTEEGPRLIEINTNAGGGLLNTRLLMAHGEPARAAEIEQAFVDMFREEWRLSRGGAPLRRIAIVDEAPEKQYLAPEFALFARAFERHGIDAVIADPGELSYREGVLWYRDVPIDLVYNRLTDFALETDPCRALGAAFAAGDVVVTPHPRAHALYADKRNLMLLSNEAALLKFGIPAAQRRILLAGVPRTVEVTAEAGEQFWTERRRWFFKPAAGFGGRAAYRGDKLTKRVFEEILQGGYIAQEIALPSEHPVHVGETTQSMKADIRAFVYHGQVQMFAARLYQGQTTNFRTPGGGFAPVFAA